MKANHPAQSFEGAMLSKVKEVTEQQGEAAVDLIESASATRPPEGTGQIVNDVA